MSFHRTSFIFFFGTAHHIYNSDAANIDAWRRACHAALPSALVHDPPSPPAHSGSHIECDPRGHFPLFLPFGFPTLKAQWAQRAYSAGALAPCVFAI